MCEYLQTTQQSPMSEDINTHGRYEAKSRLAHSAALRFLRTVGKKKSRHTFTTSKRSGLFSRPYVINILIIPCPGFRSCAYSTSGTGMTKINPLIALGGEMFSLSHNVGAKMSAWIVAARSDILRGHCAAPDGIVA